MSATQPLLFLLWQVTLSLSLSFPSSHWHVFMVRITRELRGTLFHQKRTWAPLEASPQAFRGSSTELSTFLHVHVYMSTFYNKVKTFVTFCRSGLPPLPQHRSEWRLLCLLDTCKRPVLLFTGLMLLMQKLPCCFGSTSMLNIPSSLWHIDSCLCWVASQSIWPVRNQNTYRSVFDLKAPMIDLLVMTMMGINWMLS